MRLYKNYAINNARKLGEKLGREGVSVEVIAAIKDFDGSYKGAMELCGKLSFWADVSTFDEYWCQQANRGLDKAQNRALSIMAEDNGAAK